MELAHGEDAVADPARCDAPRGEDDECLLDVWALTAGVGEVCGASLHGGSQLAGAVRVGAEVVTGVLDTERDMPRLVDPGAPRDVGGHRVRCVPLDERQVLEERSLAEHRQQERSLREVLLLEERPQRRLGHRGRDLEPSPVRESALGERFDVPGLVVHLCRQEQHDLGEVRMDTRDEPGGYVERRVFVLRQVGHDLAHRPLHVSRQRPQVSASGCRATRPTALRWPARTGLLTFCAQTRSRAVSV